MQRGAYRTILRSVAWYRKSVFSQFAIVAILSAVITGSILTGYSVRSSLRSSIDEKLGNTDILISAGLRYFNPSLSERFSERSGQKSAAIIESEGYSQNLATGKRALNTRIFGISKEFFSFMGVENIELNQGEAVINRNLAEKLDLKPGDEIIVSPGTLSELPAGSPFAPEQVNSASGVYRISSITGNEGFANFSLGISQITPSNVFILADNLPGDPDINNPANRLLVTAEKDFDAQKSLEVLKEILQPEDIGLTIRDNPQISGGLEMISARIFIDSIITDEIEKIIPASSPVLTYLVNSIEHNGNNTPYSFVASVDPDQFPGTPAGKGIVINRWLAEDLDANPGDSLKMKWYTPGTTGDLTERDGIFIVKEIKEIEGIWSDSLLMPEFPGIAGSESCTDWDAGVEINMDRIRDKDEEYWNIYRGVPKAFINYNKGKEIWGNNYGPATAIRFPASVTLNDLVVSFMGKLEPGKFGFTASDIKAEMTRAASEGVDFSTLFLSLGFFIIISAIVLLRLAVYTYIDYRKEEVFTFHALGYRHARISSIFFTESALIAVAGSLTGAFLGMAVNAIIIEALNSVWRGAVQTDTLSAFSGTGQIIAGFLSSVLMLFLFINSTVRKQLKKIAGTGIKTGKMTATTSPKTLPVLFFAISVLLLITSYILDDRATILSYSSGILLLVAILFFWRRFSQNRFSFHTKDSKKKFSVSGSYYSHHPDSALMPVLFIAAGLFAVIITGVNRLSINENSLSSSGGTGGFDIWAETALPVNQDLNTQKGKNEFGLDESILKGISFVSGKRLSGDDASCLNLNNVTTPPLLGIDPGEFSARNAFSFSSLVGSADPADPWKLLSADHGNRTIYGFADQTVLQWGLKIKTGDTLKYRDEAGQQLNIVIGGGLKSSLFQGYILIDKTKFDKYFPTVSGYSVFLADGIKENADTAISLLSSRLEGYGIDAMPAGERLASFFTVTNTYLSVFTILGGFGMILGVAGLGFAISRNYNSRKKEFSLLLALGYRISEIRRIILAEQRLILIAGVTGGLLPALVATLPSLSDGSSVPWLTIASLTVAIVLTGLVSIFLAVRNINEESLVGELKKE